MATRPISAPGNVDEGAHDGAASSDRHRLTVIAAGLADLVASSGGWLFDRARAGWSVNVLVDDPGDVRPLAILGAAPLPATATSMLEAATGADAVAVSADVLSRDARLRDRVLALWNAGETEVTVWGEHWPEDLGGRIDPREHRLSVAARAFKAHALAAARVRDHGVATTETLFDLGAQTFRPLYSV
ncbi:hypothetical protein [Mycolicibacterium holsaticum]|uniref:Uncharacterized protein n=1 Tax=Mycolicibacterium holsaticum TaxID=152142 RepID=A0A1E3RUB9_9MYCO|nr:hypothetical protein [Mycolicibacterium holsaticum]ODQ93516.1 hypothetical protein BHQ17_13035 [Mycolicibacterium holsaticum]